MGYSVFGLLYYCCKNHHNFTLHFSKTSLEGVYCMTVPQREMICKSSTFHRYDKKNVIGGVKRDEIVHFWG